MGRTETRAGLIERLLERRDRRQVLWPKSECAAVRLERLVRIPEFGPRPGRGQLLHVLYDTGHAVLFGVVALAALATLQFTWLYNDFFWGSVLLNQGDQRPITSSIAVLNGQYATDFNLIAAASIIRSVPAISGITVTSRATLSGAIRRRAAIGSKNCRQPLW